MRMTVSNQITSEQAWTLERLEAHAFPDSSAF
jgi:hypothetical protein